MRKIVSCMMLSLCLLLTGCGKNQEKKNPGNVEKKVASFVSPGEEWEDIKGVDQFFSVAENDGFSLSVNGSTCEVSVLDKSTGTIFYSNPQARKQDATAKADGISMLNSQIILSYMNARGENFKYYSSNDSVELNQASFKKAENGLIVDYTFGVKIKTYLYPPRISRERMEMFMKKMSEDDRSSFEFLFYPVDLNEMSEEDRKVYIAQSPALENCTQFYTIDGLYRGSAGITKIPDYASEEAEEIFSHVGYTQEDMEKDYAETGLEFPEDKNAVFSLSLKYEINEHGLKATVLHDSVSYDKTKFRITELELLPYFGAASSSDEGYLLVPDGSGALINLNNQKSKYEPYSKRLYGQDKAINYADAKTNDGTSAYLPVFGVKTASSAFVGLIEEGAASCSINADVSGRYHGYNHASANFLLTPNAVIDQSSSVTAPDFQDEIINSDLSVQYLFMKNGLNDYSGMANAVRAYYLETGALVQRDSAKQAKLLLELPAAVKGVKSFLGYEYYASYPLTTYKQAQEIAAWFTEQGIGSMQILYEGWGKDTYDNGLVGKTTYSRVLGGKSDFRKMTDYFKKNGITFCADANFMYVSQKSLKGFSDSRYASRNIQGAVATETLYELGTMRQKNVTGDYLVKPTQFTKMAKQFMKKISSAGINHLYLRNIGTDLNSDFHRNSSVDRTETVAETEKLLKTLSENYQITVAGGNFYTLKYSDSISDFPIDSGKSYIIDKDIPFFAMVLNGTVDLHTAINEDYSDQQNALKMIEAGIYPQCRMIYGDIMQLRDAESALRCRSFETVRERTAAVYKEVASALADVKGHTVQKHREIAAGVAAATYDNGMTVVVNYNTNAVSVAGKQIEGESWCVLTDRESEKL